MKVEENDVKRARPLGFPEHTVGHQEAAQKEEGVHTWVTIQDGLGKDAFKSLMVE